MTKYQINYSRVAPDHRVPFDYLFVKKTQSPWDYLKHLKNGFNSSMVRYYHMHLTSLIIVFATGLTFYAFRNKRSDELVRDNNNRYPAIHFLHQKNQHGVTAPWDNVLRKYTTDPFGNKDLQFKEY